DSRYKGVEALAVTEKPEFDAASAATTPPFTATFNHYIRSELGVQTDMTYEVLSMKTNEKWGWEKGELPTTGESLRAAMAKNPFMKVLVGQGYFDLATPHLATRYMLTHMNVDAELRKNVEMKTYQAGHMFYVDADSLKTFKADVDAFILASV
ncbi:MAG: hypothetical protein JXA42_24365, partial [Anaerolineales bacterium]|nr:hypothetical protein [Anaerolineales bacterium]